MDELFMNNPLALAGLAVAQGTPVAQALTAATKQVQESQYQKMKIAEAQREQQFIANAPQLLSQIDPNDIPGSFGRMLQAGANPQVAVNLLTQVRKQQAGYQENALLGAVARARGINVPVFGAPQPAYGGIGAVDLPPPPQSGMTNVQPDEGWTQEAVLPAGETPPGMTPEEYERNSLDSWLAAQQGGELPIQPSAPVQTGGIGAVDIPPPTLPPAQGGGDAETLALMAGINPSLAPLASVVGEQSRAARDEQLRLQKEARDIAIEQQRFERGLQVEQGKEARGAMRDKEKRVEDETRRLSERLGDVGIDDAYTSLSELEAILPEAGDIAGVGLVAGNLPQFMLSEEGQQISIAANNYRNALLKLRSGAAVTGSEEQRLNKEFQVATTTGNFRKALKYAKGLLAKKTRNMASGYSDDVLKTYEARGGTIPTDYLRGKLPSSTTGVKKQKQSSDAVLIYNPETGEFD